MLTNINQSLISLLDEADQTREQRQVSGNNGKQATVDHGGVFILGSETKVVVRELRPIEAVISRFFASPVEKHRTKIRSRQHLGICSTLLHRQDAFR